MKYGSLLCVHGWIANRGFYDKLVVSVGIQEENSPDFSLVWRCVSEPFDLFTPPVFAGQSSFDWLVDEERR